MLDGCGLDALRGASLAEQERLFVVLPVGRLRPPNAVIPKAFDAEHCFLFYDKLYDLRVARNIVNHFVVINTYIVVYLQKFYT